MGKPGIKSAEAANKLGWHWWPGTNAIASQKYKTLEQCGRWGVCEWGCPQGAKASFDLIWSGVETMSNVVYKTTQITGAVVVETVARRPSVGSSTW